MKKHVVGHITSYSFVYALAALVLLFAFSTSSLAGRSPISSAETQFVETSASGLSIVPASCPSATYPSSCTCQLTLSRKYIGASDTAKLTWTSGNGGTLMPLKINVNPTGSRNVSPNVTTKYTLSGVNSRKIGGKEGETHTFNYTCAATLNYCNENLYCNGGDVWRRNATANACTPVKVEDCPYGCQNAACKAGPSGGPVTEGPSVDDENCPEPGYIRVGDACVPPPSCDDGFAWNPGIELCEGTQMCTVDSDCGLNGLCAANGHCVYDPTSGGIIQEGDIKASPTLVRNGRTSTITWDTSGYTNCEVKGGEDSWSGRSGEETTQALTKRTQYTLTCDGAEVDKATVNILPVFIEL